MARQLISRAMKRAAAESRRGRRGSFIVLVVGMLALMTIVAVVYFSIGQGDARASAALVSSSTRDEMPKAVANYIAGIIAKDAVNVEDPGAGAVDRNARFVLEAWDYPWIDPAARTRSTVRAERFKPEGIFGDDPWLQPSEPTILGTGIIASSAPASAWQLYQYKRDWLTLTNIAPDGNAVNLWNLRPTSAGGPSYGGMGATALEMRNELSLFDAGTAVVPARLGYTQLDDDATNINPNIPSHLFTRVRNAFRPAVDTDFGYDDPEYLLYQFADADGDGWIDSRWQELTDASNPSADPIKVVDASDGLRYFVAATIRDLSGRVNLNTATDLAEAPTFDHPSGITPADVDVRSVLTLEDSYTLYGQTGFGSNVGKGSLNLNVPNPTDATSVSYYGGLTPALARDVGRYGYNAMRLAIESSTVPPPRSDLGAFASAYLGGPVDPDRTMQTAQDREASYIRIAAAGGSASLTAADDLALAGGFGLSDLAELLTFRVANDAEQVSLLESAVGGRFPMTGSDPAMARRYSPLRDNRPIDLERPTVTLDDTDLLNETLLTFALDPRQRLTTISGARPIRPAIGATPANPLGGASIASNYPFSIGLDQLLQNRDVNRVFRAYADALLPLTEKVTGLWDRTGGSFPQTRFMSYGYDGPELAIRLAAHSAVNFMAAAERDGISTTKPAEPFPYTLIVNENARSGLTSGASSPISGRTFKQAWWENAANQLDLLAARIAPSGIATQASAITVYGVKPQPVITQVTSYTIYVDAPISLDGDDELGSVPPIGVPPEPIEIPHVTIEGETTWGTNPDYLGRIVAVQLTNPFNEEIYLSGEYRTTEGGAIGASENDFTYYLQLGADPIADDHVYRLAAIDTSGSGTSTDLRAIVLKPGESRNVVILDTDYNTMRARWSAMSAAYNVGEPVDTGILTEWLNQQLSVDQGDGTSVDPVIIPQILRQTGIRTTPLRPTFKAAGSPDNRTIRLWRAMISDASDDNLSSAGGSNAWENDYLVDRMRDPSGTSTLEQTLNLPDDEVIRTDAGTEINTTPATRPTSNDNTGYTVVLHASVRRPDASVAAGSTGIPAYMIESRSTNRNRTVVNPYSPPRRNDFTANEDGAYWNFNWFLAKTTGNPTYVPSGAPATAEVLQPSAKEHPKTKTGGGIGNNLSGSNYAAVVPEFPTSLKEKAEFGTLRPVDTLLPFAVGPWVEMDSTGAAILDESAGDDWYTLGEALALSLDYDRGTPGNVVANLGDPGRNPGIAFPRRATDGANLVIDDYVLFRDVSSDGQFTYASGGTGDIRYGVGIPAAATIVDLFHTMESRFRDERVATPGQINLGTATAETMRAVRLLSPSDPWGDSDEWGGELTGHLATSDIASMIVAYRDKTPYYPRLPGAYDVSRVIDFGDLNDGADDETSLLDDDGRFYTTDIPGLRETPGFRSLGELLILRDTRPSNPDAQLHSIDRLGTEVPAGDSGGSAIDAGFYSAGADGLANEYSERLAIANSVSNIFTVRSDYYAVWFVLHGYHPSDVAGLRDTEPLVPSVARRFLMIVDRSNVTAADDQAQILLFKELPY